VSEGSSAASEEHLSKAVKVKAALVDPASMTVLWMDDAATTDLPAELDGAYEGAPVAQVIPLAEVIGATPALEQARDTGCAQHVQANLVSTTQGSVALIASVYPLPDGRLLLLIEHAWQPKHRESTSSGTRRARHRSG
jgi:hypothetical protein